MKAYLYDKETKEFIGEFEAQLDPLESKKANKEIWLLPADSTFNKPLAEKEGFKIKWNGDSWVYEEIPVEPEPEPYVPTTAEKNEQIRQQRQSRFIIEADPLKLDYDEAVARGEDAEKARIAWLAKKDLIRSELPYIEE